MFAAAALALAACAVGPQAHAPAATPTPDAAAVLHQFAQCMRDHGQPGFPDPTIDAEGKPEFPQETQDFLKSPQSIIPDTCRSVLGRLATANRGRVAETPDPAMNRRLAECMRQHGIDDWPDPDSLGYFHLPPSIEDNLKRGPRWPQISAALNGPCRQYNPSGRIVIGPQ